MENKETPEKGKLPNQQSVGASIAGQTAGSATQQTRYPTPPASQQESNEWHEIKERGAEFADKAKQMVGEVYDKTSRTLNEGYGHAMEYGRENPGKTVLIAFGVGVGMGLLLSNSVNPRSRASRIVPPVMNALSDIAAQLFR